MQLAKAAQLANHLAHGLEGQNRAIAFELKTILASLAIMNGDLSRVTGQNDDLVGLEFSSKIRFHCPLHRLSPDAQLIIISHCRSARAVAPLADHLKHKKH